MHTKLVRKMWELNSEAQSYILANIIPGITVNWFAHIIFHGPIEMKK